MQCILGTAPWQQGLRVKAHRTSGTNDVLSADCGPTSSSEEVNLAVSNLNLAW